MRLNATQLASLEEIASLDRTLEPIRDAIHLAVAEIRDARQRLFELETARNVLGYIARDLTTDRDVVERTRIDAMMKV